jgi:hypothetical protein
MLMFPVMACCLQKHKARQAAMVQPFGPRPRPRKRKLGTATGLRRRDAHPLFFRRVVEIVENYVNTDHQIRSLPSHQ